MKAITVLIAFLFFLIFPKPAFAVSVSIFSSPNTITDDLFTLTASISGASTGTNYLRIDLYKDGTANYFGETYNSSDWYNGSDGLQYLSVPVVRGSTASAIIQGRVGNPSSTDFTGNGAYKLRVRRYTTSGGAGSGDVMTPEDVTINLSPTPTPTSAPTSTPAPTSASTPIPTSTPTKTSTPTSIPVTVAMVSESPDILGESTESATIFDETITPVLERADLSKETNVLGKNNVAKFMISLGLIFSMACGILAFRSYRRSKNDIKSLE